MNDLNNNNNSPISNINENDDDDDEQQIVKTKIIKCKTNNQQVQTPSYNILASNCTPSTMIHPINVPNEHTSIKLHIRRICSPSPNDTVSIHPTTNLLSPQLNISNEQQSTKKVISRKFFNSNEINDTKYSRRPISTRRTSSIESYQSHTSSSIYDLPKTIHTNIYDENTLKKQTTRTNGKKKKSLNEQQEKKRTKLTSRTIKQQSSNTSKL